MLGEPRRLPAKTRPVPVTSPPPARTEPVRARFVDRPAAQDRRRLEKLLGQKPEPALLARLAGALPGGDVRVSVNVFGADEAQVATIGPGYSATRTLKRDGQGRLILRNEQVSTEAGGTGRGAGTDLFARQVEAAAEVGVHEIRATASRGGGNVGYRVLPLWGYDGPLPERFREQLPPHLASAETLQQLYALPGGRQWWETHGDNIAVRFDPSPGSPHRARLDAYRRSRSG